ncbi:hypothetical protein OY03_001605 [Salmonella enterica subsp. enterica]|nr:hypothetical protein [Salmonella enterica]ECD6356317.1 hypothetical protein [Salmonella enterica subsp. enterica serovar Othmarschen]EDV3945740.1 hypothetical protein [Salmonella enterica subsp. enterica serovar Warragul]EEJ2555414.1 hypothetical protein [Salmonella enterica subsp. enterica serovar Warragul]
MHQFTITVYLHQPVIACIRQDCASFSLLSPLAFSGLALLPLAALYLYLAFSWRNHQTKYRYAAPESC